MTDTMETTTTSKPFSQRQMNPLYEPGMDSSIFTKDGEGGLIDFVLAYQPTNMNPTQIAYRELFEEKLKDHGLELEHADLKESQDGKTCFVKIHAPWDVLARMAEVNRMRVPIRESDIDARAERMGRKNLYHRITKRIFGKVPFELEDVYRQLYEPPLFNVEFQRDRLKQYMKQDQNTFFTSTQRITIVWDLIVTRTLFKLLLGHQSGERVGITYLLSKGVYKSAFPLHDHDIYVNLADRNLKPTSTWPLRPWLRETWGRFGRLTTYQPLDQIRHYFGEKVGLYFAWLGFYTKFLYPLSFTGFIVVIYGLSTFKDNAVVKDICENMKDTIICRKCGEKLGESCTHAQATAIFNNYATVFYALFTALWGIIFLEFWKREQATLTNRWDCFDIAPEVLPPRSEYITAARDKRRHPVTLEWEPYIPSRTRLQSILTSWLTIAILVCMVFAVVIGIIIYKMVTLIHYYNLKSDIINQEVGTEMFTTYTASAISTVTIMIFEKVYKILAYKLTDYEHPRTEADFETSFTYKMYIFQFINYYAALFYLACVQPWIAGHPKDDTMLTDRCSPAGCTFSVTTQLAFVLTAKQIISNITEIGWPMFKNWWHRRKNVEATEDNLYVRHERDFDLTQLPQLALFPEYFEMIMQFGFVTMFVAAFPLAPLLALINNIFEIRVDAFKWLVEMRRCIPERARDIGTWYTILELVARLSVLTNALLIALTTDIVDRFVYQFYYSPDRTLNGYVDWALATFDPRDWPAAKKNPDIYTDKQLGVIPSCRYVGYYTGPVTGFTESGYEPYTYSQKWWHVWLSKFMFILLFEHIVFLTQSIIKAIVNDIPEDVILHVQRNRYLEKFILFQQEQQRLSEFRSLSKTKSKKTDDKPARTSCSTQTSVKLKVERSATSATFGSSNSQTEPNRLLTERDPKTIEPEPDLKPWITKRKSKPQSKPHSPESDIPS